MVNLLVRDLEEIRFVALQALGFATSHFGVRDRVAPRFARPRRDPLSILVQSCRTHVN